MILMKLINCGKRRAFTETKYSKQRNRNNLVKQIFHFVNLREFSMSILSNNLSYRRKKCKVNNQTIEYYVSCAETKQQNDMV